mgnify:CR=1 FL=1
MKRKFKGKIARATATNYKLNRKVLEIKRSWKEVESLLNNATQSKKDKKDL